MTSFSEYVTIPRSRGGVRALSIALFTAGVLLVPAAGASADHMPGMAPGVACPHASGEGPDSLAAAGPNEPTAPERAPSEAPIAPVAQSQPETAAQQQPTRPASQVTKPTTQVETMQPSTTTVSQPTRTEAAAQTSGEAASSATPAVRTAVPAPARRIQPRPKRTERRAPQAKRSFPRRFNGLEPRAAKPYTPVTEPVAAAAQPPRVDAPAASARTPLIVALALLTVLALAGAILAGRRRGRGDAAVVAAPESPAAPSYADAVVEAELHEMIAEARARAVLDGGEASEPETMAPR